MHKQTGESLSMIIADAEEYELPKVMVSIGLLKEALKAVNATEELSTDVADLASLLLQKATNEHGIDQTFEYNPYYLTDALRAYVEKMEEK